MRQYLEILRKVRNEGRAKGQRAVLASTGERPRTLDLFGLQARYDLREGFPLVTTRLIPFRLVAAELFWFLSGSTSSRDLEAQGVTFWKEWADATGDLGPVYGKQWRRWAGPQGVVDQIDLLERGIRRAARDPHAPEARRLLLTSYNPADLPDKAPPACHTLAQWDVTDGELSCHLYQRSADLFLGVPYNIACYALLTHLLAVPAGLRAGQLVHSFGSAHVYENHLPQVDRQLARQPLPLPRLESLRHFPSIDRAGPSSFALVGYRSHGPLTAEVAV